MAGAASITWLGDYNDTWNDDDGGTPTPDTNWVGDAVLANGDDLTFDTNTGSVDWHGGVLKIDAPVTLSGVTIQGGAGGNADFGVADMYVAQAVTDSSDVITLSDGATVLVEMGLPNSTNAHRRVRFDARLSIAAGATVTIDRDGNVGNNKNNRMLRFDEEIMGGGSGAKIIINSERLNAGNGAVLFAADNKISGGYSGDWEIQLGTVQINHHEGFGDETTNSLDVATDGNVMLNSARGNNDSNLKNDITVGSDGNSGTFRFAFTGAGSLATTGFFEREYSGDIDGGKSDKMLAYEASNRGPTGDNDERRLFLSGAQDFVSSLRIRMGADVVVESADDSDEVFPNAAATIELNDIAVNDQLTTSLLLSGAGFDLAKVLKVNDENENGGTPPDGRRAAVATVGQINNRDNSASYDVTFSGNINVAEDDYLSLQLTADTGGSATFSGNIYDTGGYGFNVDIPGAYTQANSETGVTYWDDRFDGEVILTGTVAATNGGSGAIGPVGVKRGTLLVNTADFYATTVTVDSGAVLGGTGTVTAAATVNSGGTLSPGASIESLAVTGNVDLDGKLLIEIDDAHAMDNDLLAVTGNLDITGSEVDFDVTSIGGKTAYVFATYGTLTGTFGTETDRPIGYVIDYNYLGGNQIALVPEPATLALAAVGLLGLRRRRRRA